MEFDMKLSYGVSIIIINYQNCIHFKHEVSRSTSTIMFTRFVKTGFLFTELIFHKQNV